MTALVIAAQIVLPLALLLWMALLPAGSWLGFVGQAVAVAAFLLALAKVAQWALPVWWLPIAYACFWLAAVIVFPLHRSLSALPAVPAGIWQWASLGLALALLAVGGWYGARALSGRALPPVTVVDIANPLGPGRYLVGHGGSDPLVNGHMRTLDRSVERFRPWRGQSYAVDFFGLGPWGFRARGWQPPDPADYAIFGATLHAPCSGTVVAAEASMPDFEIPESDQVNRLGNHVILRCGAAEIVLAHLRQASIVVSTGQSVETGDRLGEVGNSGASTEPHLHIHAQKPADEGAPPISGEPLAIRIDGRFLVRGDRLTGREG